MLRAVVAYVATGLAFVALDAAWLTSTHAWLYRPVLAPLLAERPALGPALAFYLVYVLGVVALAVAPAVKAKRWPFALRTGAMAGGLAYATYDLTNQATLKVWSTTVSLADIAWGVFATGIAATVGYFAARRAG